MQTLLQELTGIQYFYTNLEGNCLNPNMVGYCGCKINYPDQQHTRATLTMYWFYVTNKLGSMFEKLKTGAVRRCPLSPLIS